ncbi:MAG: hypothetical protein ACETWR_00855, partial [Anaerolineae bacterium]
MKSAIGILIGVLTLGTLLALDAYVTYIVFTSKFPGANDFYSRWAGGRAFLIDGLNPYSEEVTHRIQLGMYGHLAEEGVDQVAFAYPMYAFYLFFPLSLIPSYASSLLISLDRALRGSDALFSIVAKYYVVRHLPNPTTHSVVICHKIVVSYASFKAYGRARDFLRRFRVAVFSGMKMYVVT